MEFAVFERYADSGAFDAHRATPHFAAWLAGVVLPALADRVRLDLVPLGDGQDRRVAGGEALAFVTRHE